MAIIASPDTLTRYDIKLIPLPDSLEGRVIALRLDDKKGWPLPHRYQCLLEIGG